MRVLSVLDYSARGSRGLQMLSIRPMNCAAVRAEAASRAGWAEANPEHFTYAQDLACAVPAASIRPGKPRVVVSVERVERWRIAGELCSSSLT